MAYEIRPLRFGQIFGQAFRVLRDNFVLLVGIVAVVNVPYGLLFPFIELPTTPMAMSWPKLIVNLLFLIIVLIAGLASTIAIANVYLDRPTTIADSYRAIGPILLAYIGTALLMILLLILAFVALIIPGIYFEVCWIFMGIVVVVERRSGMSVLRRSRQLVRGVWWYTVGILVVMALINGGVSLIALHLSTAAPISALFSAAMFTLAASYSTIVLVVYYFDRRARVEGLDSQSFAQEVRHREAALIAGSGGPPVT